MMDKYLYMQLEDCINYYSTTPNMELFGVLSGAKREIDHLTRINAKAETELARYKAGCDGCINDKRACYECKRAYSDYYKEASNADD